MTRRGEPGRIKWRLSEILREHGIEASPYDMWTQEGAYRSRHWDLARWGVSGKWINPTLEQHTGQLTIYSWDTMTNCVRFGIVMEFGTRYSRMNTWEIEVYRLTPKTDARA